MYDDTQLLDASEAEDQLAQIREENRAAANDPDAAVALFEYGPLAFIMKDAAMDLEEDVPGKYLQHDGPNLEAASYFSTLMQESGYSHERYAAEALLWAHLAASDWREGEQTTTETLDQLEQALTYMVAERLRVLVAEMNLSVPEQIKRLQAARLREKGEHKNLRKTAGEQQQGAGKGRAAQALRSAKKAERVRRLAKQFPGKKGPDLRYAVSIAWKEQWPDEPVPSDRTIKRYLEGEDEDD